MKISSYLIKKLRLMTGSGILDCKKALLDTQGDIERAIDYLRKQGKSKALRKISRKTLQGSIFNKIKKNIGVMLEINCETDFVSKDKKFIDFGNKIVKYGLEKKIKDLNVIQKKFDSDRINLISILGENVKISKYSILIGNFIYNYLHHSRIGVLIQTNSINYSIIKYIAMHIAASKPLYLNPESIPHEVISREENIQLDMSLQTGKSNFISKKIVSGRMKKFFSEISLTKQPFVLDPKKTVEQYLLKHNILLKNFIRFEVGEKII
ncbi:translation elongation factor Ts [Buchnera aphidicola]|uniref:translation elongation factor Ts n=1 Tax=Buchnera aphidicola TaxID=9 RepID=UPI002238D675|nr:translation elongation factor Ts [Buchnera aphidicola]MCW5197754.1 translation elongation factor Ts [Buchnera aphidicola (Chaitophorus viminalis)]